MNTRTSLGLLLIACVAAHAASAGERDILIADFEGKDYGDWKATGKAFGPGPAQGTLGRQMRVTGYEGKGLVNSFYGRDGSTGTLTSPPFEIQRDYINFLVGGGGYAGTTCINLLVDGEAVRTATGPNTKPGGSERLDWHTWDVRDLKGKQAVIQIVDRRRGGWGHINVDHIVQSSRRKGAVTTVKLIEIDKPYIVMQMPARRGPRTTASLVIDGKTVRSIRGTNSDQSWWLSWDVTQLEGKPGKLQIAELPAADGTCFLANSIAQSDQPKGVLFVVDKLYQETYRPQFHFTAKTGWLNDPNGLTYYDGEYHLFFQAWPQSVRAGGKIWSHAVSTDLVHWRQLDHALLNEGNRQVYSGSGVVDVRDTAGVQTGEHKPLVAIYTLTNPFVQCIAYSNDRGRTFTKFDGNPVLRHIRARNRDPKVIWHQPTKKWVMALFLDGKDYVLYGSPDLKDWEKLCDVHLPGARECPDFFELPVDGDPTNTRWLFWGANGRYLLGSFDGKTFKKQSGPHNSNWGANCYAAQTWSNIPESDGRRLQIAWMAGGSYPEMPFNQQMSFPRVLTLRTTPDGIRLFIEPVREIENLHQKKHAWNDLALKPGENPLEGIEGELFDIRAVIEPGEAEEVGFTLRGETVAYDPAKQQVRVLGRTAPLPLRDGRIQLQILLDRTSIEAFGNDGSISMPTCFLPDLSNRRLAAYAKGAPAKLIALEVYELKSAWPRGAK